MDEQRELAPPWVEFPYLPWLPNGWTMGPAGFYRWRWDAWFRSLNESARNDYKSKYPEPKGWPGFYEVKESAQRMLDLAKTGKEHDETDVTCVVREFYETASDAGSGRVSDHEVLHEPFGRLVILLLREAVARQCNQIEIDDVDDVCPIHFVRGGERFKMDPLPKRLFGAVQRHVARMCGKENCQGQGTFSASLNLPESSAKAYGEAKVSVVFSDSSLRLTIIDLKGAAP
jgi:hypothetical protein